MANLRSIAVVLSAMCIIAGFFVTSRSDAAVPPNGSSAAAHPTPGKPHFSDYRGVSIGMTADAVRQKLGAPKEPGNEQDMYAFSEFECAQFYYDAAHNVTAIMITYSGDLKAAPTALQVLGEDVPPRPDGGVSKMVRYPKEGFWISYNRGGEADAVVSVAIQKI